MVLHTNYYNCLILTDTGLCKIRLHSDDDSKYATLSTSLTARTKTLDTNCTWTTPPALFDDLCTKITKCC